MNIQKYPKIFKKYLSETVNTGINKINGISGSPYDNIFLIKSNDGKTGTVLMRNNNVDIKIVEKTIILA